VKQAIFPIFPLIWLLARGLNAGKGGGGSGMTHPAAVGLTGQGLLRGLGWCMMPILWALVFTALGGDPNLDPWTLLPMALGLSALCLPQWVEPACRRLPVSLGYHLARSAGFNWARSHNVAGGVIVVARARRLTEAEADWLMDRLRGSPHCYALTWVAAGAVRANRGDVRVARALYGIPGRMPAMAGAEPARRMAREWLIAEALERGAWSEAREWASSAPSTTLVRGLAKAVEVFATGAAGRAAAATLYSHGRFRLARRVRAYVVPEVPAVAAAHWQDRLGHAIALQARALEARRVEDVQAACAAWDAVVEDGELRSWTRARAEGLRPGADPVQGLVDRAVRDLSELMWRERWFVPGKGVFGRASDAAWDRAWPELTDRTRAAFQLAETPDRVLYSHDAFLAWEPLRVLATAMIRDRPGDRSTVFKGMYNGSLHLAVVLYNKRGFKYFGHMVFRWLADAGDGVMTESLATVLAGNIKSGI